MGLGRTTDIRRRFLQIAGTILLGVGLFTPTNGAAQVQSSRTVPQQKAIYIRKILSFVHWSQQPESNKRDVFELCVQGDGPLAAALAEEFRGVTVDERKVVVRWAETEKERQGCRALVVGALEEKKVASVLSALSGADVLTFGETKGFLEAGGAVQLIQGKSGLQFAVNLEVTRNAGLVLDARLLSLAKRVVNRAEIAGG